MTGALEGGEWSTARPGRTLPPGMARYPFYRRRGGPQGRSGRAENLVPTGIRSPDRPAHSQSYTDGATRPTLSFSLLSKNINIKSSRNIILPVVLYGFEVWSVKLREEHRLSVFESSMLSKMFEPQREEETGKKTA